MISRYLDAETAYAEILFGLIMALTFTLGASLIAELTGERRNDIVYGVVACNVAWGIIDAVFYILAELFELGRKGMQIRQVQTALSKDEAISRIRDVFDERIAPITTPEDRARIYGAIHEMVLRMAVPEKRPTREGLMGALAVFILVSATSLPVLLPALLVQNHVLALEIANLLLVICVFFTGYAMARAVGGRGIRFGFIVASMGLILVGVAKALGG